MNEIITLVTRLEEYSTRLNEDFELDMRVRFIGDGRRTVFVSVFNNEEHTCCYVDSFVAGVHDIDMFCDNFRKEITTAGGFVTNNKSELENNEE